MSKHILVTGSRDWPLSYLIASLMREEWEANAVVHHGGARGADTIAGAVARRMGLKEEIHPAQWSTHGRRAGFVRNQEMVELKPDVVLAFQMNNSKGCQHTIDLAKAAGIPVKGYRIEGFEE